MIVPKLNILPEEIGDEETLVERIKHWGFLGKICVTLVGSIQQHDVELFRRAIKKASGYCDMLIDTSDLEEATALDLLNDGVSMLFRNERTVPQWPTIPADRVIDLSMDPIAAKVGDRIETWVEMSEDEPLTPLQINHLTELDKYLLIDTSILERNPNLIADSMVPSDESRMPTVICDPLGIALGLAYSNRESLRHAIATREGTYWSRSRNELWVKGKTSGATQKLLGVRVDCDSDCLRFTVTQDAPGFCHKKTHTCFGEERSIATVIARLKERVQSSNGKSFTRRLATDASLLEKKLLEEAKELSDAAQESDTHEVAWEAADVLYFSLVAMLKHDVGLEEVYAELARRMNRVVRRD